MCTHQDANKRSQQAKIYERTAAGSKSIKTRQQRFLSTGLSMVWHTAEQLRSTSLVNPRLAGRVPPREIGSIRHGLYESVAQLSQQTGSVVHGAQWREPSALKVPNFASCECSLRRASPHEITTLFFQRAAGRSPRIACGVSLPDFENTSRGSLCHLCQADKSRCRICMSHCVMCT